MEPIAAPRLAVGGLIEPFAVGGLLARVVGFTRLRVTKSATAHGLIVSLPLPATIAGHSWYTTERA